MTSKNIKKMTPEEISMLDDTFTYSSLVAKDVGVNAATIYDIIRRWIRTNRSKNRNLKDGMYWTYNSIKSWQEDVPHLTQKNIRVALDRLCENGYIEKVVGKYNKNGYDRTTWYTDCLAPEYICPKKKIDSPSGANGFDPQGEPIPITYPITQPSNTNSSDFDDIFSIDDSKNIDDYEEYEPIPEKDYTEIDSAFYSAWQKVEDMLTKTKNLNRLGKKDKAKNLFRKKVDVYGLERVLKALSQYYNSSEAKSENRKFSCGMYNALNRKIKLYLPSPEELKEKDKLKEKALMENIRMHVMNAFPWHENILGPHPDTGEHTLTKNLMDYYEELKLSKKV
jgi:hypothetical protein